MLLLRDLVFYSSPPESLWNCIAELYHYNLLFGSFRKVGKYHEGRKNNQQLNAHELRETCILSIILQIVRLIHSNDCRLKSLKRTFHADFVCCQWSYGVECCQNSHYSR